MKHYQRNIRIIFVPFMRQKEFIIDLRAKLLGYLNFALKNYFIYFKIYLEKYSP